MRTATPALIAALVVLVMPRVALAATPAECLTAENQIHNTYQLRRTAKAIENKELRILVLGAGSSVLPGEKGTSSSYPARLQNALKEQFPNVNVSLSTDAKSGRTAAEMAKMIGGALGTAKPHLMVWQTGTVDAVRSVDPDQFNASLGKGLDAAEAAGVDVVLMNQQFSPRTESLIALTNYSEAMRWVALQHETPLFDRFQIMKTWNELGTFDLYTATKNIDIAARVHDCIGRLLADFVVEAASGGKAPLVIR